MHRAVGKRLQIILIFLRRNDVWRRQVENSVLLSVGAFQLNLWIEQMM